jgi:hypothetical protein
MLHQLSQARPPGRNRSHPSLQRQQPTLRLHGGGNRQINAAGHRIAVTQMRMHPPAISYIA